MLDAGVGMQERTDAMGRCHALARPVHAHRVTGMVLGVSGRVCLGQCRARASQGRAA